jgi:hypothetical protein
MKYPLTIISNCFLAIIGGDSTQSRTVDFEMGLAVSFNKLIVPIVEEALQYPEAKHR